MSEVLVPLEPLFVDRARELAEFDGVLAALTHGRSRHLALLGLRRIGKTMLLDEVRRRHPQVAIVYLALDEVVSGRPRRAVGDRSDGWPGSGGRSAADRPFRDGRKTAGPRRGLTPA